MEERQVGTNTVIMEINMSWKHTYQVLLAHRAFASIYSTTSFYMRTCFTV